MSEEQALRIVDEFTDPVGCVNALSMASEVFRLRARLTELEDSLEELMVSDTEKAVRIRNLMAGKQPNEPVCTLVGHFDDQKMIAAMHRQKLPIGTELYTSSQPAFGYALAPLEPTEAMITAGLRCTFDSEKNLNNWLFRKQIADEYKAMLAAQGGE